MAVTRSILSLVSILLLAGGIVMEFFIVLSGSRIGTPVNQVYFLQSTTNGIAPSPQNPSRWTFLSLCGVSDNGLNANCGSTHAAFPFAPSNSVNFGTTTGVPDAFGGSYYYLLSRAAWGFYIVALFFAVIAFFLSALAICTRLGSYLAGATTFFALILQSICAALHTAWVVKARDVWNSNGQTATIGKKALGFVWATWACLLLCTIFFCIGGSIGKSKDNYQKKSYFGRKKSTRSRGSFIDSNSERRVKDEYE